MVPPIVPMTLGLDIAPWARVISAVREIGYLVASKQQTAQAELSSQTLREILG